MKTTTGSSAASAVLRACSRFIAGAGEIRFHAPVVYVYNPLVYAWAPFRDYVRRYARPGRVLFLGMNPGPWGMAQTGVPFGVVGIVSGWLGIGRTSVGHPPRMHPRVPVRGFDCTRSEVSGSRFWGLMMSRFPDAPGFFREHFVANYCPLLFLDRDGRNVTPDKIAREDRSRLFVLCDALLKSLVKALSPRWVAGIGSFARARAAAALDPSRGIRVVSIPHPSPASPLANRGWADQAVRGLEEAGVW